MKFVSRAEFRTLPLKYVITPTLDGPVLVHTFESPIYRDLDGRTCLAYAKLDEMRAAYRKIHSALKLKIFAREMRRLWLQLVDQADGYTWPTEESYVVFAFADDARAL